MVLVGLQHMNNTLFKPPKANFVINGFVGKPKALSLHVIDGSLHLAGPLHAMIPYEIMGGGGLTESSHCFIIKVDLS